jgi:hypothetical protein
MTQRERSRKARVKWRKLVSELHLTGIPSVPLSVGGVEQEKFAAEQQSGPPYWAYTPRCGHRTMSQP